MSQPDPTPTISISAGAATLLAVAVLAGTALVGIVVAQAIVPVHPYLGSGPLFGAVATLSGGGFLTHLAVAKVMRRFDELEEKIDETREAGYAAGYVDGAAGGRRLSVVNDR